VGFLRRLLGDRLPEGFAGVLADEEHVVGSAEVQGGGHLVVTALGLWVPGPQCPRRIGWHLISKAAWAEGALAVTEADEASTAGDAVFLVDRASVRFAVPRPGKVPILIRQRVDGSIRSRYRKELPGGGAWFVRRKVPGRDGTVLQVRVDPGGDTELVASIAREAAERLAEPGT
jgi:hypothetical protein